MTLKLILMYFLRGKQTDFLRTEELNCDEHRTEVLLCIRKIMHVLALEVDFTNATQACELRTLVLLKPACILEGKSLNVSFLVSDKLGGVCT